MVGGTTRQRRAIHQHFKLKARLEIIHSLSGPITEEHFIYHQEGDKRRLYFDWSGAVEIAEIDGIETDATKAYALSKALWRSTPRQIRCLDDAADEIEAKLIGDPRYWQTINALADALLAHKTYRIGHDAAVRVMRQAWRKKGTEIG